MSKEKIDELLGITGGIDDFLNTLSVDSVSNQFKEVDDNVKAAVQNIDNQLSNYNMSDIQSVNLPAIENSLNDIHELIETSKQIIKHIHSNIITSDLLDSELIQAFSKLLESAHLTISEYIELYKSRLAFVDKIKIMMFQQDQKKELLMLKHKLDMEKNAAKIDNTAIEAEGKIAYTFEEVQKMLNEQDYNN